MKNRFFKSIATKLILAIGAGAALAALIVTTGYSMSNKLYSYPFFHTVLSYLSRTLGVRNTLYLTGALLFVAFVFLVTRKSTRYLRDIVGTIRAMEKGNLDIRVDIRTRDELGELAASVNSMAERLKLSIEEERRAERAKKELISSVSHDLRTPLTSVIGFLGLLNDRSRHSEADLERFAAIAHKKALKLQELLDELFEYTRVSYSGIQMNTAGLNLTELLEQLAEEFYPLLEEKGMELRLTAPNEKTVIQGDGELIARLFENLLNNAVRYGRSGKYIDVTVGRDAGMAVIQVINYGDPIPRESLPHVFERFYRSETSRSRETGGTGLGLAIAKSITELHKGSITAASDTGRTCFEVRLPKRYKEA